MYILIYGEKIWEDAIIMEMSQQNLKLLKININPDKEFVNDMRKALKDNNGFCPCSLEKNEDTKCMCKEFREMASGTCHCGLYTKTA